MDRVVRPNRGFSLIELAMIMTIVGLVVAVVLQQYRYYLQTKQYGTTETNITSLATAMSNHLFNFGDLPCPASRQRPPGDQRAGKAGGNSDPSSTTAGVHASCLQWVNAHFGTPTTTTPYCEANPSDDHYGICMVRGQRATTYGAGQHAGNDIVLIGAVPYVDLGMTIKQSLDGWGNRLIYAVSFYETQQSVVQSQGRETLGSINIQTFDRVQEQVLGPGNVNAWSRGSWGTTGLPNSYMYVAFSAGPNGKGAYSYGGQLVTACAGQGWDVENCNDDATFRISGSTQKDSVFSLAAGPDYYDDVNMVYDVSLDRDKWSYTSQTAMQNKSGGSVGIGSAVINSKLPTSVLPQLATAEEYRLDVAGDLVVNHVDSQYYCDANGANCFDQSLLASASCNGAMMTGFANGKPICNTSLNNSVISGSLTCPPNQYLKGFTSDCSCNPPNTSCTGTCPNGGGTVGTYATIVCGP